MGIRWSHRKQITTNHETQSPIYIYIYIYSVCLLCLFFVNNNNSNSIKTKKTLSSDINH